MKEDRLKYHLAILQKIRIQTPADIEDKIRKSLEFSKEIKKKCMIQAGTAKSANSIAQDKKRKLSELINLYEEKKSYSYITQEMIILEQQLNKAKQWVERVKALRGQEAHNRTIE